MTRSLARALLVLLTGAVLALGALAVAGPGPRPGGLAVDAPAPRVSEPLPFDHGAHADAFDKEGLACVHCHPVGLRTARGAPEATVAPLRTSCHGCHLRTLQGAPRKASASCDGCHPHRRELIPASHGLGWLEGHGVESRALGNRCADCHEQSTCVACHEGRGALVRSPHGPGFRATHGVEARVDPASCSSCHTEDTCSACHTTGVIPW